MCIRTTQWNSPFLPCGFRAWNPSGRQGNKIFNWLSLLDTSDFAIFNAYSIQWPKVQILCIYSFKFICLFNVFVCAYSHATVHVCGCQRTTCRNWFSPTIFILGIKLRSLGLALSTYTRWAIFISRILPPWMGEAKMTLILLFFESNLTVFLRFILDMCPSWASRVPRNHLKQCTTFLLPFGITRSLNCCFREIC